MTRITSASPLALVIGVLAVLWTGFARNHRLSDGGVGDGLSVPSIFHLVLPAAFLARGFVAASADNAAVVRVAAAFLVIAEEGS